LGEEDQNKWCLRTWTDGYKRTNGSGGYGMLIGNSASEEQMNELKKLLTKTQKFYSAAYY
jgi:uncharacterized circularly permuted ATP-grasp superfamily protein